MANPSCRINQFNGFPLSLMKVMGTSDGNVSTAENASSPEVVSPSKKRSAENVRQDRSLEGVVSVAVSQRRPRHIAAHEVKRKGIKASVIELDED